MNKIKFTEIPKMFNKKFSNNFQLFFNRCYLLKAFSKKTKINGLKWDIRLVLPYDEKNNLEEFKFKEIELKKLTNIADSTINYLNKVQKDLYNNKKNKNYDLFFIDELDLMMKEEMKKNEENDLGDKNPNDNRYASEFNDNSLSFFNSHNFNSNLNSFDSYSSEGFINGVKSVSNSSSSSFSDSDLDSSGSSSSDSDSSGLSSSDSDSDSSGSGSSDSDSSDSNSDSSGSSSSDSDSDSSGSSSSDSSGTSSSDSDSSGSSSSGSGSTTSSSDTSSSDSSSDTESKYKAAPSLYGNLDDHLLKIINSEIIINEININENNKESKPPTLNNKNTNDILPFQKP